MPIAKRKKFIELADKRVNKSIHSIHLVGNLSNRSNYEYTDKDVKLIMQALDDAVADVRRRFKSPSGTRTTMFSLEDR